MALVIDIFYCIPDGLIIPSQFFVEGFISWLCKNQARLAELIHKASDITDFHIANVGPAESYIGFKRIFNSFKVLKTTAFLVSKYFSEEVDVDGFRCDHAHGVPLDFWQEARTTLDAVKPIYMVAEDGTNSDSVMNIAFDSNYHFDYYDKLLTDWHNKGLTSVYDIQAHMASIYDKKSREKQIEKIAANQFEYTQSTFDSLSSLYDN